MKPFIAVVGERSSGKSTVICSLAGCRNRGFRGWVRDNTTRKLIYVIASSPQENARGLRTARDLRSHIRRALRRNVIAFVMALQPYWRRTRRRLDMVTVLRTVQHTGRFALYGFVLDPPYRIRSGTHGVGGIIRHVRTLLQGANVNIALRRIDGRRFALLNARRIWRMTGVP